MKNPPRLPPNEGKGDNTLAISRRALKREFRQLLTHTMNATAGALSAEDALTVWREVQEAQEDCEIAEALGLLQELAPAMTDSQRERFHRTARRLYLIDEFEGELRREAEVANENCLANLQRANGQTEGLYEMAAKMAKAARGEFSPLRL